MEKGDALFTTPGKPLSYGNDLNLIFFSHLSQFSAGLITITGRRGTVILAGCARCSNDHQMGGPGVGAGSAGTRGQMADFINLHLHYGFSFLHLSKRRVSSMGIISHPQE